MRQRNERNQSPGRGWHRRPFVGDWRGGRHSTHLLPNLGPMAANDDDNRTVTIEVEMADSESPEGMFQSVIQVRISSTEQHACELVREAIQLAIQTALEDGSEVKVERKH